MPQIKTSKKVKAFQLFAKGETPSSASVKALELSSNSRYNYYSEWKKLGSPSSIPESGVGESKGKIINELQMVVPPEPEELREKDEELRGDDEEPIPDELRGDEPELVELLDEKSTDTLETPKAKPSPTDGKKPPQTLIAGQGLTFSITISTKTLALYQIAASMQKEELTLGDFIDTCVEDTYRGRGLDLGLVRIGGEHNE